MHESALLEIYRLIFNTRPESTLDRQAQCVEKSPDSEFLTKIWRIEPEEAMGVEMHLDLDLAFDEDLTVREISMLICPDNAGDGNGGEGLCCDKQNGCYWADDLPGYIPPDREKWEQFAELVWSYFSSLVEEDLRILCDSALYEATCRKAVLDKYYEANPHLMRYYPCPDNYASEGDFYVDCVTYIGQKLSKPNAPFFDPTITVPNIRDFSNDIDWRQAQADYTVAQLQSALEPA